MLLKRSVIKINVADAVVVCEAIDIEDNGTFPASVDWQINARGKFNLNPASRARSSVTIPVYQMSDCSDRISTSVPRNLFLSSPWNVILLYVILFHFSLRIYFILQ